MCTASIHSRPPTNERIAVVLIRRRRWLIKCKLVDEAEIDRVSPADAGSGRPKEAIFANRLALTTNRSLFVIQWLQPRSECLTQPA
jgi:hypothetical protein